MTIGELKNKLMLQKIYNIYCDESSVDNKSNHFMVIGGLFMMRNRRNEIRDKIKELKHKYKFNKEIKWSKVSMRDLKFYRKLIDLFFSYDFNDLAFHCIKVEKTKVKYDIYHNDDKEEGFYKFYYQLLKNKFKDNTEYYIFLDFKPTKTKKRVKALSYYLNYRILAGYNNSNIKKIQEYDSNNNVFIQLADFFTGVTNYASNNLDKKNNCKADLQKYISSKLNRENLNFCSLPSENKFNIFCIEL